jgi:hypothetical protein
MSGETREETRMEYVFPMVFGIASPKRRRTGVATAIVSHPPRSPKKLMKRAVVTAEKVMLTASFPARMVISNRRGV